MGRLRLWWVAVLFFSSGASAASLPDCAGPLEIESVNIVRVERNAVLVLHDGRAIHLEGIRFPNGSQDRAPGFLADQATDALNAMARGHRLSVAAVPPKQDRYDRVRGQVFDFDAAEPWLQIALLKRGLARVEIAPDRIECWSALYAAEAEARAARAGLWSSSAYAIRTPDTVRADTGSFQIVQGTVLNADVRDGRAYLNFGADWKTDFTVTISPEDMANFRQDGVDPRGYTGKTVRVRGIVQQLGGPEIEIANPQQVEVVP